jgi:hypothetical protein
MSVRRHIFRFDGRLRVARRQRKQRGNVVGAAFFAAVVIASWALRPESRTVGALFRATDTKSSEDLAERLKESRKAT